LVCGAVAALAKYPLPCIIFDLGTAITISALDENGCFLGGTISPGVWLSLEALASGTAQLPHIGFDTVANVIGTNSTDSMKSGAVFGTASMIDGMIEHYSEALGKEAYVVATGGVAPDIVPYCKKKITVDPNLLLEGLLLIYKKNAG
jgi:type III pantothenate kinase